MVPTSLMVAFALGVSFCRGATSSCRGDTHTSQHAAHVNRYLSLPLYLQLLCGLHARPCMLDHACYTKVQCKLLMAVTSMGSDGSSLCGLHLNLALFVISKHDLCPGFCTVGLHRQQLVRQCVDAKQSILQQVKGSKGADHAEVAALDVRHSHFSVI